jgi:ParB-like chromosome segregation protein Spo0J
MVRFHDTLISRLVDISTVQQHPDNPNDGDIEEVALSMQANGVYKGVSVQTSTGYILEGNTRYAALLMLGSDVIPVDYLDVDDREAWKILLADNEIARKARMDQIALGEMLETMHAQDPILGLVGSGYDLPHLERLRSLQMELDKPLILHEPEEPEFAKQRGVGRITCPQCHYEFGGSR